MALNGTIGVGERVGWELLPPTAAVAMAFDAGVELATALDDAAAAKVAIALDGKGVGVVVGSSWIVPGVVDGIATAIGTGVELASMIDDVVVGLSVGIGWEVAAMLEDAPAAVDVNVVDDEIVAVLEAEVDWELPTAVDGVAVSIVTTAGVGRGTKPGNGLGGVGAAITPSVGKGLATEGEGMGTGAGADWEADTVLDVAPLVDVGLGMAPALDGVVFGRM
jgi:hypothetical protein